MSKTSRNVYPADSGGKNTGLFAIGIECDAPRHALLARARAGEVPLSTELLDTPAYLSPTIVEAILNGQFPAHLTMKDLMEPFPMEWERQREHFFGWGSVKDGS